MSAVVALVAVVAVSCSNSATTASSTTTAGPTQATTTVGPTLTAGGDTTTSAPQTTTTKEVFQKIDGVPGVSDTEISFAAIGTGAGSNVLGTCTLECYSAGIEAYFAFRNSQGGVHGRQLKLTKKIDDELGNNQVKSLEIINSGDTFATFSIPFLATGFPEFAKQGVPLYTTVISALEASGQLSTFPSLGVSCISCSQRIGMYMAKQVGAKSIAALGYGVSQPSKDCVATTVNSIAKYGKELGLTLGYSNDALPYALPNGVAPEVTAMKNAGVTYVSLCVDGNAAKTIVQEMKRQNMTATVLLPGDGYASKGFLEESGPLFEGDIMTITFRPFEATSAGTGLADFNTWIKKTSPDVPDQSYAMFGWMSADLAYKGILDAGPVFDRKSVIAATNALKAYTGSGLYATTDWGRQHVPDTEDDRVTHGRNPQCTAAVRITGGKFELFGGTADKPWLCWDPAKPGYSEPVLTNFP